MRRRPGLSVRLKLTLSYAGFLMIASGILLGAVWLFLLRYVPENTTLPETAPGRPNGPRIFVPNQSDLIEAFTPRAMWALAFLLAFGLVGGWFLAGRMLSPLRRITSATRLAGEGSLSHRIRLEGRNDELHELADSFDTMLARLESHVGEHQRFAANASHELRTPLAITQTLLEVARDDPTGDQAPNLIERLHSVNRRAIDLTDALLLLSRSDGGTFAREQVDLSLVVEEACETLLPSAEDRDIALDFGGEPVQVSGSGTLLVRMTMNLVQNAIVHNITEGGSVSVHTQSSNSSPGDAVLRVENTGLVLTDGQVSRLTEPFQRGTERTRSDDHDGVGLGLAIVASVVSAHAGTLELSPRSGGGLLATVRLPVSAHQP